MTLLLAQRTNALDPGMVGQIGWDGGYGVFWYLSAQEGLVGGVMNPRVPAVGLDQVELA